MPLLKGKENIGHNVREMEKSGHPKAQAVAAALHTALDDDGEEGTINSKLTKSAQAKGALVSHDAPEMHSTTAMTVADMNKKNESYWNGENGNVGPTPANEASSPKLGQGKIAVYNPHAEDEVSPTQALPPETRSDNLLERPGGIPSIGDGVVSGYKAGKEIGERVAQGEVGDDLAEGTEAMIGEGTDSYESGEKSAPMGQASRASARIAFKKENPGKPIPGHIRTPMYKRTEQSKNKASSLARHEPK